MWLLVFLIGAGLAFNGYVAALRPETVVHQIHAAAYLIGGVVTMALSVVIYALAGLRGDIKRLTAAVRDAPSARSAAPPSSAEASASAAAVAAPPSRGLDRDALSAVQARWAEEERPVAARPQGFADRERWLVGGAVLVAIVIAWFYL